MGSNFDGQLGDTAGNPQLVLVQIGVDNDWAAVGTGSNHSLAIKTTGALWAWGSNSSGQLGNDVTWKDEPNQVAADSCVLDSDGDDVTDDVDNCPLNFNPDQSDVDGDGSGDVCDPCDDRPIVGGITPAQTVLWPPDRSLHPITLDASGIGLQNPDGKIVPLVGTDFETLVQIHESSRVSANTSYSGDNIYEIWGNMGTGC